MTFTFPKDKVLFNGVLKQYSQVNGKEHFKLVDPLTPLLNTIQIDSSDYYFTYLNDDGKHKGSNSIILKLYDAQSIDPNDPIYDEPDLVLKIHKSKKKPYPNKSQKRFSNEIVALQKCKDKNFQNIIRIEHSGECKIFDNRDSRYYEYYFYTMEFAQYDLKSYIEKNHYGLSLNDKINLCIDLAKGLKELNKLSLYHRDIKPDNIFMNADGLWKIGDLGLVNDRDKNFDLDKIAEPVGPKGWMSPESMNKYLTEDKGFQFSFQCEIDHQSDIFQLGKVFWYIFQHNAPIGTVKEKDFLVRKGLVYSIIKTMLNHSKRKRYKEIDQVIHLLKIQERKVLGEVEEVG
jgi:serine/threonine protein kinase